MAKKQQKDKKNISAAEALQMLKDGNKRYKGSKQQERDLKAERKAGIKGQEPFAAILSCMDSRTSAELVFDQGLGHLFSIRVAGNVVSDDVLGSLEYAVNFVNVKLIVVMSHTGCGAMGGAIGGAKLGHLTGLLDKIKPAIKKVGKREDYEAKMGKKDLPYADAVAAESARVSAKELQKQSDTIAKWTKDGVGIVPALYDIATGVVTFYEDAAVMPDTE